MKPEERVALAKIAIAEILKKYRVEFRGDYAQQVDIEPIEVKPPKLKIVQTRGE